MAQSYRSLFPRLMLRRKNVSISGALFGSIFALHCGSGAEPPVGIGGAGGADVGSGGTGAGNGGGGLPSIGGVSGSGVDWGGFGGDAGGSAGAADAGPIPIGGCGDGVLQLGEACDDGNGLPGDGCAADCSALERDFSCLMPGQPCVSTVKCDDGGISGAEVCDDGNHVSGDGCSADCRAVEPGWSCLTPGLRCEATACGDGVVAGFEECDFNASTLGCTDCRIDPGYDCPSLGSGCVQTLCGDGTVEHGEQCDDANDQPFDGCFDCRREPACEAGVCQSACGDGQRFDDEECDDGNTRSGDGCSATCTTEVGYVCTLEAAEPPATIELPIIYRDFIGQGNSLRDTAHCYNPVTEQPSVEKPEPCFHIDFNELNGAGVPGVVESELGDDGRPVYVCIDDPNQPGADCDLNPGHVFRAAGNTRPNFNGPGPFAEWYDSGSPSNIELLDTLTLERNPDLGTYVFAAPAEGFYPINGSGDGLGWVAAGEESLAEPPGGCANNVSFTSETHFWFEYQGGEAFEFRGDDDLWVFVNRQLAIDLGGLHVSQTGSFVLDADTDAGGSDTADGSALVVDPRGTQTVNLGLSVGGVYEVALFHAERNECGSNFKVTLEDFNKPKSVCRSTCGDGVVASDELCDGGAAANDGGYGHCAGDCLSRGPYCGDHVVQTAAGEKCDDGENLTGYGSGCAPGCQLPAQCGDGIVNAVFGEQCDDGVNDGLYGGCTADCQLAERCGDGTVQQGERCDDGNLLSGDGCSSDCYPEGPR